MNYGNKCYTDPSGPVTSLIGLKGGDLYLVVYTGGNNCARYSMMRELGFIFVQNLDSGGSSSLYYDGRYRYIAGPGRDLIDSTIMTLN